MWLWVTVSVIWIVVGLTSAASFFRDVRVGKFKRTTPKDVGLDGNWLKLTGYTILLTIIALPIWIGAFLYVLIVEFILKPIWSFICD